MTYWDMDEYQVEDVMTEFLKKSLAQSEFDAILDSYVFNIHDLQLDYLKSQFYHEDGKAERDLHRHFLQQYFKTANNCYGSIQDDSYIFYNLGYHLFKSEQFDMFPKIYLNLGFVESMMKATSSVDLLNDYKRYGEHIIGPVFFDAQVAWDSDFSRNLTISRFYRMKNIWISLKITNLSPAQWELWSTTPLMSI